MSHGTSVICRSLLILVIPILLFVGCGSIKTFEGSLESVKDESLMLDCSAVINKGKSNANSVGTLCEVKTDENTDIMDENGENMSLEELPKNRRLKITFKQGVNLEKNQTGTAQIVQVLNEMK
ncbi:hypothetical protein [Paenibacillus sp. 1001270B_150601_E10]|uniref:hypothetical protein n=1 Tax=Paenibacillus sp. 1001270B_150601_E10 TaxID=2787079 RepID=UPI0018A00F5E|nr:hypothetical protein [Paenibacillus sp. 1001270B_150601_E10]